MSIGKAALLGVVQGITSILPVGSSGHAALFGHLLGDSAVSLHFMVFLHIGTLIAVVWFFQKDLGRLFAALLKILAALITDLFIFFGTLFHPEKRQYRRIIETNHDRMAVLLLISTGLTIPVAALLRRPAFSGATGLLLTAMGFFVSALLLFISSYTVPTKKNPKMTRYKDAAVIGLFQGFSALPGISRAGIVWSAAALCGITPGYRIRYMYLLAVPSIIGSFFFVLPSSMASQEAAAGVPAIIVGAAVSAIVSAFMIRWACRILQRVEGKGLAVYMLAIGIVCILTSFH